MNKYIVEVYFEETGEWCNIVDDYIYADSPQHAIDYFKSWYYEKTEEFPYHKIRVLAVKRCFLHLMYTIGGKKMSMNVVSISDIYLMCDLLHPECRIKVIDHKGKLIYDGDYMNLPYDLAVKPIVRRFCIANESYIVFFFTSIKAISAAF